MAAAGQAMAQIRKIIDRLDQGKMGVGKLGVFEIDHADAVIVQEAMAALFASAGAATHTPSAITTALYARGLAGANSQSSPGTTDERGGGKRRRSPRFTLISGLKVPHYAGHGGLYLTPRRSIATILPAGWRKMDGIPSTPYSDGNIALAHSRRKP